LTVCKSDGGKIGRKKGHTGSGGLGLKKKMNGDGPGEEGRKAKKGGVGGGRPWGEKVSYPSITNGGKKTLPKFRHASPGNRTNGWGKATEVVVFERSGERASQTGVYIRTHR